jgi:hypothetical protein
MKHRILSFALEAACAAFIGALLGAGFALAY